MSDSTQQMDKEKQLKIAQQLTYERNIGDVTKDRLEGFDFNTENLLYTETTQGMVVESEIEALANYSEIKAKQRSADPIAANELHSEQFQTGKNAIGLMNSKKSHRAMHKRKNKMKESTKRLNKVGSDARKLKENVDGMPQEERIESLEKLYNNVRIADRYFAEGVAGNKNEENKLKEKAEINYVQNLCNLYSKEMEKTLNSDKKAELREKMNELSEKLNEMRQSFTSKYNNSDFTQHRLSEGEKLSDFISEKASTEQSLKNETEEVFNNYEKGYKENSINKNNVPNYMKKSGDMVNEYLYLKSNYTGADKTTDNLINMLKDQMQNLAFLEEREADYLRTYEWEKRKLSKTYNEVSYKERTEMSYGIPAFKHYEDSVRESMLPKLYIKLQADSLFINAKRNYDIKRNLVNNLFIKEQLKLTKIKDVEILERQLETLNKHLEDYSPEKYKGIDLTKEREEVLNRIDTYEIRLQRAKREVIENYAKETNIEDTQNVDYYEALTYYKSSIKLKDKNGTVKSLQDYDMDEEIPKRKEIAERTNSSVPAGVTLDTEAIKLNVWSEKLREARFNYYFPKGSELVEKLKKNLKIGNGDDNINRQIESCLRIVKFDDRGNVLKGYEKNDEFNRKLIDSHVNTTLTEDTKNDDKAFEERLPALLGIIDEFASLKIDDEMFSIDYITKSQDNFLNYQHITQGSLTFTDNLLKDRVNAKLKDYCEKDPKLKKKYEMTDKKIDIIRYRNEIFRLELSDKLQLNNEFKITTKYYEKDFKMQMDIVKDGYEKALKAYNDKFGGE